MPFIKLEGRNMIQRLPKPDQETLTILVKIKHLLKIRSLKRHISNTEYYLSISRAVSMAMDTNRRSITSSHPWLTSSITRLVF